MPPTIAGQPLLPLIFLLTICNCVPATASASQSDASFLSAFRRAARSIPLVITNNCSEAIWPAIASEAGTGPDIGGFELQPKATRNLSVGQDWQGRVWGRTNCTFNANGTGPKNASLSTACMTGDCARVLDCTVTGNTPVTLAEFNLEGGPNRDQTFYDISLVDGYNLPLSIIFIPGNNSLLRSIPPNLINPSCIATSGLLSAKSPFGVPSSQATNNTFPLPYEPSQSNSTVEKWCPWENQLIPNPSRPGDGVYPYPVDHVPRPAFNPCVSACSLTGRAEYCCTGSYDDASKCHKSYYSSQAKSVCPDAYSYAFDDATSTFSVPAGGGWEVVFCPAGRSTDILRRLGGVIGMMSGTGVTEAVRMQAGNVTLLESVSGAGRTGVGALLFISAVSIAVMMV
ncbi:thaumatin family protein [Xylogone sp. PMI_703]|nr:thaumatin family protein [Xylogone sp. PMI_703]